VFGLGTIGCGQGPAKTPDTAKPTPPVDKAARETQESTAIGDSIPLLKTRSHGRTIDAKTAVTAAGPGDILCYPSGGKDPGMDDVPSANWTKTVNYLASLCFMEFPGSDAKPRGKRGILLWILPESRVHNLNEGDVNKRGRIVARIWNSDWRGREFDEWPDFKRSNGPVYVWVGPVGNPMTRTAIFFQIKWSQSKVIEVKRTTNFYFTADNAIKTQHDYAQAGWGHPEHKTPNVFFIDDGKSAWFNCEFGCCTMGDLWEM
jgi:hypothetical protein